jgi:hypothetical protein
MSNAIFPFSVHDADLKIISFCDTATQLQLGRVNQRAFVVLKNQFFFDRFYGQHPLLETYQKLCCALLRSAHETNYEKVMCKVLDPEYRASFPGRFSFAFIEDGARFEKGKLHVKRQVYEEKNRAICGSHYEDPASPIDQAWKRLKACEEEAEAFHLEYKVRMEELEDESSPALAAFAVEEKAVAQKVAHAQKKYDKLEALRIDACHQIEDIDLKLASLPQSHAEKIMQDLRYALILENSLKNKSHLDECILLIIKVNKYPQEKTPENFARIRYLINSCTYEQETHYWENYCIWGALIWRELYFRCARGVIEDSWAENHFQDHLVTLGNIVHERRTMMRQRIAYANITQATLS